MPGTRAFRTARSNVCRESEESLSAVLRPKKGSCGSVGGVIISVDVPRKVRLPVAGWAACDIRNLWTDR